MLPEVKKITGFRIQDSENKFCGAFRVMMKLISILIPFPIAIGMTPEFIKNMKWNK
jgi:hypothetical protein